MSVGTLALWDDGHIAGLWRRGWLRLAAADDAPKLLAEESDKIQRAQAGDREAFAALVEHYWDRLYRWLYHLTHHQHTAEDLAQDTFLKAFSRLSTFRCGSNFQAWIFRIAYNGFLNQRRVANRLRSPFPEDVAGVEASPDEQAISKEAMQQLARAVGRLPGEFRAALLLRMEEGLSFREIAEVLETTEQTARWRVFKARQKLMTVLAPQLDREKP
ncbi:MAG: sigma-70 family RNA polymerase sigma factor [Gemmataceae bacterium]|nr:sigma-70 family RNA polymerase sigma factor [Gemmataceae bacterium]